MKQTIRMTQEKEGVKEKNSFEKSKHRQGNKNIARKDERKNYAEE